MEKLLCLFQLTSVLWDCQPATLETLLVKMFMSVDGAKLLTVGTLFYHVTLWFGILRRSTQLYQSWRNSWPSITSVVRPTLNTSWLHYIISAAKTVCKLYASVIYGLKYKLRQQIINTLRTGDADLRFYITTVQDGWCKSAFLTRACFPCTVHLIMQYKEPVSEWSCWRMFIETWPHSELTFRHRASSV